MEDNQASRSTLPPLRRWEWLALAACLVLFAAQAALSSPQKSAAFDEEYHLSAGYAYLKTGDFRLSRTVGHPPLANLLNALPLLLLTDTKLPLDHPAWQNGDFQWFSDVFLWGANGNPQQMIELARLSSITLGMLTALLLFIWARQLAGPVAGWLALLLAVLDPNLLANSRLITTDLALSFFVLLTMWRLWTWLESPSHINLILVGLSSGLAMSTKYTGLLLWPIILSVLLIYPRFSWKRLWNLVLMGLIAYLVVWATYRFDVGSIPGARIPLPVPAPDYPASVWRTFTYINEQPVPAFLFGQVSPAGWWYYFPVTLALKTPLPLLLLSAMGLVTSLFQRGWRRTSVLWLPAAAFLLLAMAGRFNIGYRHILQVVPFLIILASFTALLLDLAIRQYKNDLSPGQATISGPDYPSQASALRLGDRGARTTLLVGTVLIVALLWQGIGTFRLFPHYESYFNELAGGPEKGGEVLVDSNIDWGQDLPALRQLMADLDIDQVYLSYFGTAPPEAYGVNYKPIPGFLRFAAGPEVDAYNPYTPLPGWYAISVTSLQLGLVRQNTELYSYFRELEPVARAGYSIHLYEVSYPDSTPVNRTIVTGQSVADIDPGTLGVQDGHRLIVKWAESPDTTIMPAESAQIPEDIQEVMADFGDAFTLLGYRLEQEELLPGGIANLTLYWRAGSGEVDMPSPAAGDPLATFVHLSGEDPSRIFAQHDGWGAALTGLEKGDVIVQQVSIEVPEELPAGIYFLRAGLYSPQTSNRLPVNSEGAAGDFVTLTGFKILDGQ